MFCCTCSEFNGLLLLVLFHSLAAESQGGVEMGTEVTTVEFENTVVVVTGEGPVETKGVSWEDDPRRELEDVDNSSLCEVETSVEKRVSGAMCCCCVCVCVRARVCVC